MFFPEDQNDYARNKSDSGAIVYKDQKGRLHLVTVSDFPGQQEFDRLKLESDEMYHEIFQGDRTYYDHKVSIGKQELESMSSVDIQTAMEHRKSVLQRYRIVEKKLRTILTKTQFRRYKMHVELRMTQEEIAKAENVCQSTVSETLSAAEKRIDRFFRQKL